MAQEEKQAGFGWARFIKVQQNLPNIPKSGQGNYGKYMKLEDLNPALLKLLNDNDFAWVTMPVVQDGKPCLRYSIVDTQTGVSIGDIMELASEKNTPQAQGSAITYARRYSLTAMTGIVADMDDDGAEGSKEPTSTEKTLMQLTSMIGMTENRDQAIELYKDLTPNEKKIALPLIQAKLAESDPA